jgi:hypothetical protein
LRSDTNTYGGVSVGALEFPQESQLRASQGMFGVVSPLRPMDIEIARVEIHVVPSQGNEFRRAQPVAKHQQDDRRIAHRVSP